MKTLKDIEKKLNEVQEELAEFKKHYRKAPKIGEVIEIADMKWRILDKFGSGYFAIIEGFESLSTKFDDDTNNWEESDLRNYLNTEFFHEIESDIGEAHKHPTVIAHKEAWSHLKECFDFHNGIVNQTDI